MWHSGPGILRRRTHRGPSHVSQGVLVRLDAPLAEPRVRAAVGDHPGLAELADLRS